MEGLGFGGKKWLKKWRKVDTKLELWKIPSGTSPEEAGLVSVVFFLGAWLFFCSQNKSQKICKNQKNTEKDDLYKGISAETGTPCVFEVFPVGFCGLPG